MLNKTILKLINYFLLVCLLGSSSAAIAELDYTCPEAAAMKIIIIDAIQQGKTDVVVPTRFGILQTRLNSIDIGDLDNLMFDYASLLYDAGSSITYEIACSYKTPSITFYTYSKNASNPTLYMGLSPFWIPQNSSYATCTYSAKYCIFKEKP